MYEASEAGIGYLCRLFRIFEEDCEDLSLTETIPEYVESRALIQETVKPLSAGRLNRVSSSEQTSRHLDMFSELYKTINVLEASRPELNKAKIRQVAANRRFFIGTGVAIVAATAALIRVMMC